MQCDGYALRADAQWKARAHADQYLRYYYCAQFPYLHVVRIMLKLNVFEFNILQ